MSDIADELKRRANAWKQAVPTKEIRDKVAICESAAAEIRRLESELRVAGQASIDQYDVELHELEATLARVRELPEKWRGIIDSPRLGMNPVSQMWVNHVLDELDIALNTTEGGR